jgi:hypothetical protein
MNSNEKKKQSSKRSKDGEKKKEVKVTLSGELKK